MTPPGPSLAFLAVMALVRIVGRTVDAVALLKTPGLFRLWWRGVMTAPSPWRTGFPAVITAKQAGVPVDDLVYGEAFVVATRRLLRRLGVGAGRVVVDLGCGRGGVLLAATSLGATARGVELLPTHVEAIAAAADAAGITVEAGDARFVDDAVLADADLVWLSWVTWSEATRAAVSRRLLALRPGALVVGVCHAVAPQEGAFVVVEQPRLWCTWGRADVVVSRRC